MSVLLDWLRQQLDADEAEINRHPDGEDYGMGGRDLDATEESNYPCSPYLRIDKAFALRQVAALRAILDLHEPRVDYQRRLVCDYCDRLCHSRSGLGCEDPDAPFPCDTVKHLAAIYADRPGYAEAIGDER